MVSVGTQKYQLTNQKRANIGYIRKCPQWYENDVVVSIKESSIGDWKTKWGQESKKRWQKVIIYLRIYEFLFMDE